MQDFNFLFYIESVLFMNVLVYVFFVVVCILHSFFEIFFDNHKIEKNLYVIIRSYFQFNCLVFLFNLMIESCVF
jgi:hypothetical protein